MFNLRNRSFLKEIDFEPQELRFMLKLSEALKIAKYSGTEVKRLDGKEIALIFEKSSTRTRSGGSSSPTTMMTTPEISWRRSNVARTPAWS